MEYLQRDKLLMILVGVLVVLNIGTLSFILLMPGKPDRMAMREGGIRVQDFLDRELNFNKEQKEQYTKLREDFFHDGSGRKFPRRSEAMQALLDLVPEENVDMDEVRKRAAAIGEVEAEHVLALFNHFRQVRAICTDEQKPRFDRLIRDVLERMPGPPPPNRGPETRRGPNDMEPGPPPQ